MPDCLFCKIIAGEIPCHKIFEDDLTLAFLDIKPLNPGHALVIPKNHSEHLLETSIEDARAIMNTAKKITPVIMQSVGANGCNVTCNIGHSAGQIIFHTHVHVIPRYDDDGFKSWQRDGEVSDGLAEVAERIKERIR